MVGSFIAWPVLYVREDCDSGWIFEIVGLEEVEAFLLLARLPISEYTFKHCQKFCANVWKIFANNNIFSHNHEGNKKSNIKSSLLDQYWRENRVVQMPVVERGGGGLSPRGNFIYNEVTINYVPASCIMYLSDFCRFLCTGDPHYVPNTLLLIS